MSLRAAFAIGLWLVIAQPRAWTFAALLSPPSAEELRRVDDYWARKVWDVAGTSRIGTTTVPMGRPGVDWAGRLVDASRDAGLQPDTRESQFLDWFVRGREALPLTELRRRTAAASPLYFAERLPPFQIHQGDADLAVPVRNATALRDRVSASDTRRVFIYAWPSRAVASAPILRTSAR